MSDIQVGDVWSHSNPEYRDLRRHEKNVVKLHEGGVAFWSICKDGDLYASRMSINAFIECYTLTLRDGKPVKPERVFEEGSYWAKMLEAGSEWEVVENRDGFWYRSGIVECYDDDDFQIIWVKLEEPKG